VYGAGYDARKTFKEDANDVCGSNQGWLCQVRDWWILIALVPFIGFIVLIVFLVQPSQGPNQYGERPDTQPGTSTAFA
jgi:uncharacterized membrane protein YhaH (DUF805 family)